LLLGSETEEDGMKDEDNMAEKKNEMRGEERHGFDRAVFIFGGRKRGLNAEDAEEARRDHRDKKRRAERIAFSV
jgi:hypothetical protein